MRVVALGYSCNNACVFCAQGELRATTPRADAAIDADLAAVGRGDVVAIVGGEPTLWERLPAWIAAADAAGARRVLVQTNGRRLAYPAYARLLRLASPRLSLDISLHGATEAMHDYHTAVAGSFKQTVQGLRNARVARIPAVVTTVVTRSNFRHLAEITRVAHACGASAIRFAPAEPFGRAAELADRVVPALELAAPHLRRAVVEARRLGLGACVGDDASDRGVVELFAGLGDVEERALTSARQGPTPLPEGGSRKVSLAVLGRPSPGRRETRAPARVTGEELGAIFPDLFANAGRPAEALGPRPLSPEQIRACAELDAAGDALVRPRRAGSMG